MKRFSLAMALTLVAACSSKSAPTPSSYTGDAIAPMDVVWTQLVNATASGNNITKSGGDPSLDDAGGVSTQSLGAGDGWLEVTVADPNAFRFVGLATPHAGTSDGAIDFAFRLQAGRADVYERGAWAADNTVVAGDTLRVAVSGGIVTYSKNGNAIYASTRTPSYPLAATASLIDAGAAVTGAELGLQVPATTTTGGDLGGTFVAGVMAAPSADGTAATVTWMTNVATDGQVQYGADTSYGTWSVYDGTSATSHSIALSALTPGATYHYRVRSQDAAGNAVYSADATLTEPTPAPTTTANRHRFCGWLMATGYVSIDQDPNYADFVANAAEFDAVHPMWYTLATATTFTPSFGEGSALVLNNTTVGGKRTLLIPTIAAADGTQPQLASQIVNSPSLRAQHEAAIVALVMAKSYDGIDLDYEHLNATDQSAFSQFASELGALLHAQGKTLSFAVGGLTAANANTTFWDYNALSQSADQLHVMGYDFHYLGSHPGPVTPLGWIQTVLAYIGTVGGGGRAGKFILGLPNYGLSGPDSGTTSWFGSSMDSINLVGGTYDTTTTHMTTCPFTNGVAMAPGRAPNATTSAGAHVFFDDIASHQEKVSAAQAAGLGGITYW
ncbi:MAG TPA: glycosyl hydrolase family 18 protein, partial [Polyangia bacterium]